MVYFKKIIPRRESEIDENYSYQKIQLQTRVKVFERKIKKVNKKKNVETTWKK